MKTSMTLALATGALTVGVFSGGVQAAQPSVEDIAAMQGVWTIESLTLDGHTISPEQLKNWRRVVDPNNHVTWKSNGDTIMETDIEFDTTQKPMTLDSTIATGGSKSQIMLAIYELSDNKACLLRQSRPASPKDIFEHARKRSVVVHGEAREVRAPLAECSRTTSRVCFRSGVAGNRPADRTEARWRSYGPE